MFDDFSEILYVGEYGLVASLYDHDIALMEAILLELFNKVEE